ncbi:hypothetical protein HPCPY3281_0087 [Helicobacter pylori CPY3281]|nr:hypothetical protein HPCPY3281_0087 [Helicobacter pylori CPY3281]
MKTPFNPQLIPLKTLFKEPFALAFFRTLYKKSPLGGFIF